MDKKLVAIILTFNSEKTINKVIIAAKKVSKNVVILDSFSEDNTISIAKKHNCKIIKRKFFNYSHQRNFIIQKYNNISEWQLHLDSDEIISNKLIKNIKKIIKENDKSFNYMMKRQVYFLNKKLRFGAASNWHLRLFRSKTAYCENKKYDQHFVSKIYSKKIGGLLLDKNDKNLNQWIQTHNNWSYLASKEIKNPNYRLVKANLFGNNIERNRYFKNIILKLPIGFKGFILFFIKYFIFLGFLDGKVGFIYCFLNSFWFHTLVDAKKYESKSKRDK